MKRLSLAVCAACALLAVGKPDAGPSAKDLDKLQGEWLVLSVEAEGKKVPDKEVKEMAIRFIFKKGRLSFAKDKAGADERPESAKVVLDAGKTPKWINTVAETKAADVLWGIYDLDGDNLKICLSKKAMDRPKAFTTKEGVEHVVYVLKRRKP